MGQGECPAGQLLSPEPGCKSYFPRPASPALGIHASGVPPPPPLPRLPFWAPGGERAAEDREDLTHSPSGIGSSRPLALTGGQPGSGATCGPRIPAAALPYGCHPTSWPSRGVNPPGVSVSSLRIAFCSFCLPGTLLLPLLLRVCLKNLTVFQGARLTSATDPERRACCTLVNRIPTMVQVEPTRGWA